MVKSVTIKVFGKVQGVFYRQSTREQAYRLCLAGFVQNQPDGSVYAEAEGEAAKVDALITWCRKGPSRAQVTKVIVEDQLPRGFTGFDIIHT